MRAATACTCQAQPTLVSNRTARIVVGVSASLQPSPIMAVASDKSVAYEIKFDLSNVNDPSNKVTAPANAIGL